MLLNILRLLLLAFVVSNVCSLEYGCPEPEDIYPCYCEDEEDDPTLVCNNFNSPEQISAAIKGLKGHRILKMSFYMNHIIDPVPADVFKDVAVQELVFENSSVTFSPPQFKGAENHLEALSLRSCFNISHPMTTWSLGHLIRLKELTLTKNRIPTLPDSWLGSVPDTLKSLYMESNSIVTLGDNALSKVKRLTFLVLDDNRLMELKRSIFPNPASDLRSLSFNSNRLRYLPEDIFTDMPNLRIIEIQNNRFTTLERRIWFDAFSQVAKLELTGNPLHCDGSLKWITEINKPILFYGDCQTPEDLKGKSLKILNKSDLN